MPKAKAKAAKAKFRLEFCHHDMLMTRFRLVEEPQKDQAPILRGPATVEIEAAVLNALIPDFSPQHNSAEGAGEFWFEFK